MKNGVLAMMSIVCVGLSAVAVFLRLAEDRKPPEIHFQKNEITYTVGSDYGSLLLGVTATDNRDGDVTDSLVVESVYPNDDGATATIVYVARDSSNNIGKANKLVKYQTDDSEDSVPESSGEQSQENESNTENAVNTENNLVNQTTSSQTENTNQGGSQSAAESETESNNSGQTSENPGEEQEDDLPEGSPHIKLTTDQVTINRGAAINRISYVESITDDKDEKTDLWRKIEIIGDEFDRNTPGTYEQIYYVVDSDGNKSNEAKLTIIVQ